MPIEITISKVLTDLAVHTGVDVVSKRSINPMVRGAARFYALVAPASGVLNAIRIAAYSDALGLAAYYVIVHLASERLAETMVHLDGANFEIAKQAEGYLLTPEFVEGLSEDQGPLSRWTYDPHFPSTDFTGGGRPLFDQTVLSVERAMRSYAIANELLGHPESSRSRPAGKWSERESWVDLANKQLGYVFWRAVPEVGLGLMKVTTSSTYRGVIRRNTAEGYGRIEWSNGNVYFGQVRDGEPRGYGVFRFAAGNLYVGHIPKHAASVGASIGASRNSVFYGRHIWGKPDGYGRRVGLSDGIETINGMWIGDEVHHLPTLAGTYDRIAVGMRGSPWTAGLLTEYAQKAKHAQRVLDLNDAKIVSQVRELL